MSARAGAAHRPLGYSLQERRGVPTAKSRRGAERRDRAGEATGQQEPLPAAGVPSPMQGVLPGTPFGDVNRNPLPGDPLATCWRGRSPCPSPS